MRNIEEVRMMLLRLSEAAASVASGVPSASAATGAPPSPSTPSSWRVAQPGSGWVERDNDRITEPMAKAMPPASSPAMGVIEEASAMDSAGLNMKPMSSSTPSYENMVRNSGASFPRRPVRMRYVHRARTSACGLGTNPISSAAANSTHSGPRTLTHTSMMIRPTSVMAAATGTMRDCPRSSMSFDTRGAMRNVASATADDTKPAMKNEYPANVSMVTVPMFIM